MPSDWQTLANPKAPLDDRLEALNLLARACTAADAPGHELERFATAFIDEVVRSGRVRRALDGAAALAARPGALPARPDTAGPRAEGPSDLVCDPYELRSAIPPVLYILCKRSPEQPALTRWLFEAAKLFPAERRQALAGLSQARVDPDVLADGIESLAAFAAACTEPGRGILRDTARAWLAHPAWLLALVDRLAREPAAADALAAGLYGDTFAEAPAPLEAASRAAWMQHALRAPSGARAAALGVLAHVPGDDGLEAAIRAALDDRAAHIRVHEAAARLALARRLWSPALVEAAARCRAALPETGRERMQVGESLIAVERSGAAALAPAPTTTADARLSIAEGTLRLTGPALAGGLAIAAYRRALVLAPASDWQTDDDELGLAVAGPGTARFCAAPVRFPARATGAAGARRAVELVGIFEGRAVLAICSPFSDDRGWGNDNYALGCDPATGAWVAYRAEDDRLVIDRELTDTIDEAALPRVCFGEAVAWIDAAGAHLVADTTPYHLDDWEKDAAVSAAQEAQAQARAASPWTAVEAPDLAGLAAAWPALATGEEPRATAIAQGESQALVLELYEPVPRCALIWRAGRTGAP